MMDRARWKQIDEMFDAALDVPESGRIAFLDERCAGDPDLKNEVLALLGADSGATDFLESSAMGVAARSLADQSSTTGMIGRTLANYEIESLLGSGGMGEVFLAHDSKLHRKAALKILPPEYKTSDERVKRFELEARAISALNHPNIVTIYDVGNADGIGYIATEYVEGRTLRELIGSGALRLKDTLNIIIQTCEALSAAHGRGIIHRDIKPENIIVRPDGYVKILDFGLAKLSEIDFHTMRDFNKTAKGLIIGTPAYMSPEQVADEKVDHRTDLWSIGVVLYELLTGLNPFKKQNRQATFQAILSEDPPPASTINRDITPELDQIIGKALEKDADLSYQTASDLRADLKRIKRELDSSPSWSGSGAVAAESRGLSGSRILWTVLAGGLIIALLGFGWYLTRRGNRGQQAVEWVTAKHLQITQTPGLEGYPSLSPDGRYVIFASETNGNRDIIRLPVDGGAPTNLTSDSKSYDSMPVYSPDGKSIAFRSDRSPAGIYVMGAEGGNPRRVSDLGFHPAWSADGTKIVVSDKAAAIHTVHSVPNSSLYVVDVATGERTRIETGGDAIMPKWSPNGHRIAFWFVADGKPAEIATVPAEGGQPVVIATDAASDWNPVWSPDGRHLYFASDRGGNMNFWRIPIDERTGAALGEPESVPTPSKYCRHLAISSDGKRLAYVRYESQSNIQALGFDPKTGKRTGDPVWITRGDREISNPMASPDGTKIIARVPLRTQEDLGILNSDGSELRLLTNDRFRERQPRWSPDGRRIAFQTDRSGSFQIWLVDPDGSNPSQVTFSTAVAATVPIFSPDGNRLAYTEIDGTRSRSLIIDLNIPAEQRRAERLEIDGSGGSFSVRDWSADGRKLLFTTFEPDGDERGFGTYDLETKNVEILSPDGVYPVWLADSRRILYMNANTLFLFDTVTRKTSEIYKPFAYEIHQPSPSADNRFIYFRYLQIESDVWLIDAKDPL